MANLHEILNICSLPQDICLFPQNERLDNDNSPLSHYSISQFLYNLFLNGFFLVLFSSGVMNLTNMYGKIYDLSSKFFSTIRTVKIKFFSHIKSVFLFFKKFSIFNRKLNTTNQNKGV